MSLEGVNIIRSRNFAPRDDVPGVTDFFCEMINSHSIYRKKSKSKIKKKARTYSVIKEP